MNRRGFLGGLAAAVVATAVTTRLGRTLADVMPKPQLRSIGAVWKVEQLGGYMYSDEMRKVLNDTFRRGHGIGKTSLVGDQLQYMHVPSSSVFEDLR